MQSPSPRNSLPIDLAHLGPIRSRSKSLDSADISLRLCDSLCTAVVSMLSLFVVERVGDREFAEVMVWVRLLWLCQV